MELTGRIIAVLPAQSGVSARTGNSWMTQEYVLEVPGQYPKKCLFRIFGEERIRQFNIQQGDHVKVMFDIDARESNGRWFNDIKAFNIVRATNDQPNGAQCGQTFNGTRDINGNTPAEQPALFPPAGPPAPENDDDLPF